MIYVETEVVCNGCGKSLHVAAEDLKRSVVYIEVEPCDTCMKKAEEEGAEAEARKHY